MFRDRFKENYTVVELEEYVDGLIDASLNNWRTQLYDDF